MKRGTIGLALLMLTLLLGCSKPPTPPPTPLGSTIVLKVFVLRDWNDGGQSPRNRLGYIYGDNHIRSLVNDMINRSDILAGTDISFSWPGQQVNEILTDFTFNQQNFQHVWLPYTQWVPSFQAHPQYDPNAINIFFVPGIIDASNPAAFMDSFTIDPAGNNDPFWDSNPWKPMMIISDCWVHSGVSEEVRHDDEGARSGMVPENRHFEHLLMHHALGRYLFRHTDVAGNDPPWDGQENWVAGDPLALGNYMRRWTWRVIDTPGTPESQHVTAGVWQGEIFERIDSGNWNNP